MVLASQNTSEAESPRRREPDLTGISQVGQPRALRKGQSLYLSGDTAGTVLLVKAGRLKLSRLSADGKELILALLEPGDLLALPRERAFRGSEPLVEALEPAVLVFVRQQDFEAFILARPDLAVAVIGQLTRRVRELEQRIEEMVFKDIPGRLATALLRLAAAYGSPEPSGGTAVGLRVTQQELANLIGASREMVNHALSAWKREGLIELHGRSIVIRRTDALEALESAR
ncbi:MAG: Crp/Fnr family transcriptional regulator [Candidatus Rokubacteria bacterium]|nr:Crp/Fnr family transcriptional regulator [Candidatus Rokubacteria bacterium]